MVYTMVYIMIYTIWYIPYGIYHWTYGIYQLKVVYTMTQPSRWTGTEAAVKTASTEVTQSLSEPY